MSSNLSTCEPFDCLTELPETVRARRRGARREDHRPGAAATYARTIVSASATKLRPALEYVDRRRGHGYHVELQGFPAREVSEKPTRPIRAQQAAR